ncbi:MAG: hypothetical protein QXP70_03725 [Methanomassiliicoccales archaeon]
MSVDDVNQAEQIARAWASGHFNVAPADVRFASVSRDTDGRNWIAVLLIDSNGRQRRVSVVIDVAQAAVTGYSEVGNPISARYQTGTLADLFTIVSLIIAAIVTVLVFVRALFSFFGILLAGPFFFIPGIIGVILLLVCLIDAYLTFRIYKAWDALEHGRRSEFIEAMTTPFLVVTFFFTFFIPGILLYIAREDLKDTAA